MILLTVVGLFFSALAGLAAMLLGMGVRLVMMTLAATGAIFIVLWVLSQ